MRGVIDFFGRLLVHVLFRIQIDGLERFPDEGAVIIMSNHVNFSDVCVLSVLMPRQPVALAKQELFASPILGPMVRVYGVIPIARGEVDRTALRRALELLAEGKHVLMIAPEGHRSRDGRLLPGQSGVAFLAVHSRAIVVPIAVVGVEPFWHNVLRFKKTSIRISVGRPFRFNAPDGTHLRGADLAEMTTEAMYQLALLCPPECRGAYADISQATTNHLDFQLQETNAKDST